MIEPRMFTVKFRGSVFHMIYRPEDPVKFATLYVDGPRLVDMVIPPIVDEPTARQKLHYAQLEKEFYAHAQAEWLKQEGEDDL